MCADSIWSAQAYCCCFQVTAPQGASLNLAFAADDQVQSATLNDKALTVVGQGFQTLAGKVDAGSAFFNLGTNTLVVKVLNRGATPYGFYAEGTAIHQGVSSANKELLARLEGAVKVAKDAEAKADTADTAAADKAAEADTTKVAATAEAVAATEAAATTAAAAALDWARYVVQPKHYSLHSACVGQFPRAGLQAKSRVPPLCAGRY